MTTAAIDWNACTECYAVPGAHSIIDMIHPLTGRTCVNGSTPEEMHAREPQAVRMLFSDWQAARAAQQRTPITWVTTTRRQYDEMLNILPPIDWNGGDFLVGEPHDHMADTGEPTYQAYRQRGSQPYTHWLMSSRSITRRELRDLRRAGR